MSQEEIVKNLRVMRNSACPILAVETPMCGALLIEQAANLIEAQAELIDALRKQYDAHCKRC